MTNHTTDKYTVDISAYDGVYRYLAHFVWIPTGRSFRLLANTKWGIKHQIRKQIKRCAWADKQNGKS